MRRLLPAFQPHEEMTRRQREARDRLRCCVCGRFALPFVRACSKHLDAARAA